ncbi:Probable ATP synthase 24 kDa subunit, mitochondrial [Linum perenne]
MLKNIFLDVKRKFETAIGVLRQEKITIAPEDPAAVAEYAKVMKSVRQKADLLSESQSIKNTIDAETKDIPDARAYLSKLQELRIKLGIKRQDLPKYEEDLELKLAKAQLEELKKDAHEAMGTQKKREEFKDEEMPDVKSLDIRNFI